MDLRLEVDRSVENMGRKLARLNPATCEELGVADRDYVLITGRERVINRVIHSSNTSESVLVVDESDRYYNLGQVAEGDEVSVEKVDLKSRRIPDGNRVVFEVPNRAATLEQIRDDVVPVLKEVLLFSVLREDEVISLPMGNVQLQVLEVDPKVPGRFVRIGPQTEVSIRSLTKYPVDTVILIDRSGSTALPVTDTDPTTGEQTTKRRIELAKEIAWKYMDEKILRGLFERVGLIAFSNVDDVETVFPLTVLRDEDAESIRRKLQNITYTSDVTAIGEALYEALRMFSEGWIEDHLKYVVLFSDGAYNIGRSPDEFVKEAQEKGIVVFAYGIVTKEGDYESNTKLLEEIAVRTGGRARFVYEGKRAIESLIEEMKELAQQALVKVKMKP